MPSLLAYQVRSALPDLGLGVAVVGALAAGLRLGVALCREQQIGLLEFLVSGVMVSGWTHWVATAWRCRCCPPDLVSIFCLGLVATLPVAAGAAWARRVGRLLGFHGQCARLLLLLYGWSLTVPAAALLLLAAGAGRLPIKPCWYLVGTILVPLLLQLWLLPAIWIERRISTQGREFSLDARGSARYPSALIPDP